MTDDLSSLDAVAQAQLVRSGEASALELVDAAIARIEALEPNVHALATTDFEAARTRARSGPTGPMGGVPFLVKDLVAYPGMRHAMGARLFDGHVATEPSPYSRRLDEAGVVVLGKTTTSELGLLGSTETLLEGTTYNPWDPTRSAGGSSGGSGAAVATRMVPVAHASDGGGSIRIPAAMNGVFGLKPSAHRVVRAAPTDMNGLVVEHCMSWSVRDSALMLALTERTDGPLTPVGFVDGPRPDRLCIGAYTTTLMGAEPSSGVRSALESTVSICRDLGHDVVEMAPPPVDGPAVSEAFFTLAGASLAQLALMMEPMLGRAVGEQDLEPFTLSLLERFRALPEGAEARALDTLRVVASTLQTWSSECDVTLCPTIPVDTFELGTLAPSLERELLVERTECLAGYTPVHNFAGLPAMSVPLHMSEQGWPMGSHFAAARGGEATLLSLAYELEAARPWRDRRPSPGRRTTVAE